jgi:hypothetical protein
MAESKTTRTDADVDTFLAGVADDTRRTDAHELVDLMRDVTGVEPAMWGSSIVGFGSCRTVTAAGRAGTWPRIGFSPRARNLAIYVMDHPDEYGALLDQLGKHSTGKACLYVTRLDDVDEAVLREIVAGSWAASRAAHADAVD